MKTHKNSISKYLLPIALAIFIFVLLTGFRNPKPIESTKVIPTTHTVTIFKMKFKPADLKVRKGDTVVWVNKDFYPHDVTEMTARKWTSKPMELDAVFSKVIESDVKYFCDLHKVMKGTITVTN